LEIEFQVTSWSIIGYAQRTINNCPDSRKEIDHSRRYSICLSRYSEAAGAVYIRTNRLESRRTKNEKGSFE
jgi:hypothetical protein